jgi:hypothetical protein
MNLRNCGAVHWPVRSPFAGRAGAGDPAAGEAIGVGVGDGDGSAGVLIVKAFACSSSRGSTTCWAIRSGLAAGRGGAVAAVRGA